MPHIIAYTFDSDVHCPECAIAQVGDGFHDEDHDNNGISLYARGRDDNFVNPIFDTDEIVDGAFCADCKQFIK